MGVAMLSIFNGKKRGPGVKEKDVWIQVSVGFREHLHHFKGAKLGVFLAIALHMNEDGWAWPGVSLLSKETGYSEDTVSRALAELCQITIEGYRVLLKYQPRIDKSKVQKGVFASNRYLFFPTLEEVEKYKGKGIQHRTGKKPLRVKAVKGKPPNKEEPSFKDKQKEPVSSSPEPTTPVTAQTKPVTEKKEDYIDLVAHFASAALPPKRELVRDVLAEALNIPTPESSLLLRPWEEAVDSLVIEFRKMHGKRRLTDALVETIIVAISEAKKSDSWHMCKGPTATVVGRIVAAGRNGKQQEKAGVDLAARQAGERERMEELARAHGH